LTIVACDEIAERLKVRETREGTEIHGAELDAMQLDYYLWLTGKEEGFRSMARHATKDTFYY